MELVATVLAAYPRVLQSAEIIPLGNRGGFSGARVWCLDTAAGALCLLAGAATESRSHLLHRHAPMARAHNAGLHFVPVVLAALDGNTVVEASGLCWELMEWMPGRADFHDSPTPGRLAAAVAALAELHRVWEPSMPIIGPVPAVGRRLEAARSTTPKALVLPGHPLLGSLAVQIRRSLTRWLPESFRLLHEWESFTGKLQPCLRDVWHDNLLFDGDVLTGLVDYAGAGLDGVSTDLAHARQPDRR